MVELPPGLFVAGPPAFESEEHATATGKADTVRAAAAVQIFTAVRDVGIERLQTCGCN
jgi:hypothetical protein